MCKLNCSGGCMECAPQDHMSLEEALNRCREMYGWMSKSPTWEKEALAIHIAIISLEEARSLP